MISVGDFVDVSLPEGGFFENYEVLVVPGNNRVYWTLENSDGEVVVVGPSILSIRKVS